MKNICEKHKKFKGELCPICLMNERDVLVLLVCDLEDEITELLFDQHIIANSEREKRIAETESLRQATRKEIEGE